MKIKDISEEVRDAKALSESPSDPWEDYISWKNIRAEGYDKVKIDGVEHEYNKWGLSS